MPASNALPLEPGTPRNLAFAEHVRTDYRLLEVDEHVLQEIAMHGVIIKGSETDDAVLCTSSKTFAMKFVETTNLQLLVEPEGPSQVLSQGAAEQENVSINLPAFSAGLQTQWHEFRAADKVAQVTVTATAGAHIELVEVAPRLERLHALLSARQYGQQDGEEDGMDFDHGDDQDGRRDADHAAANPGQHGGNATSSGHDRDWEQQAVGCRNQGGASASGGSAGNSGLGLYTFDDLLELVQASPVELRAALQDMSAVQIGRYWRLVSQEYMGGLLEMLLLSLQQEGIPLSAVPLSAAVTALSADGYHPRLVEHCMDTYATRLGGTSMVAGSTGASGAHAGTATAAAMVVDAADGACTVEDHATYTMQEEKVCVYFARKLLSSSRSWQLQEFLTHWRSAVPAGMVPEQAWLRGEALVEGAQVRLFSRSSLPKDPEQRFNRLFQVRQRWESDDFEPYLRDLKVPGCSAEALLLKYTRSSQLTPDSPLVYTRR